MTERFDQDLARWEEGDISLEELQTRHPDRDVSGLVQLRSRLATLTIEPTPEPDGAWEALRATLPDHRATLVTRIGHRVRRPVILAAAATLLTAGMVFALEPVRQGAGTILQTIAGVVGGGVISLLDQHAPTAQGLVLTGDEDLTLVWHPGVADEEEDPLTCSIVAPAGRGEARVNSDCSVGSYVPEPNFNGRDRFTYRAGDGEAFSAAATVTITVNQVNDLPRAGPDAAKTDEDTSVTFDVLANDTDVDEDSLRVARRGFRRANPHDTPMILGSVRGARGTVTGGSDGSLTYVPPLNFFGTDAFTYRVVDGHEGFDIGQVSVRVRPVNDAPVASHVSGKGDEDLAVDWAPSVTDVEKDSLTCSIVSQGTAGKADVRSDCSGGTYVPDPDVSGPDSFAYTVSDGTDTSDPAAVTLIIRPVNDVPVAAGIDVKGEEDVAVQWAPSVSDVEGDKLTCAIGDQSGNGTAEVSPDCSGGTYVPNPNVNGSDTFTYTVSDGTDTSDPAAVMVTLQPVNDAPVALEDAAVTEADVPVTIQVLANDVDPDGDLLTVDVATPAVNGTVTVNGDGTLTYTPNPGYIGPDSFTYAISDGFGGAAIGTVVITVTPPAVVPVPVPRSGFAT